jgi:hypothetical protein
MVGFYYFSEDSLKYIMRGEDMKFLFDINNNPVKPRVSKYIHDFYILKDKFGKPLLLTNNNMGLEDFKNILKSFRIVLAIDRKKLAEIYKRTI